MALDEEFRLFLGISPSCALPGEIVCPAEVLAVLDRMGIEGIIPDREPFLLLNKAVMFRDAEGNNAVLSLSGISEEDCAGHIPEQLMTPLILFSKAIALTGRLLAGFMNGGSAVVAEVVKTGPVESLLTFSDLRHTKPPIRVVSYAKIVSVGGRRIVRVVVDTQSWIATRDKFVPAGKISDLEYAVIPKHLFLAALRR